MSLPEPLAEVLKCALIPERPLPAAGPVDAEALYDLAAYHRLVAPLLARLGTARPAWCPSQLLTRLRVTQHHVRRQTSEMMAAAREITHAMCARGLPPPVFIKGFSAYALTADPHLLHHSADLDPFAADLPAFWDVAHELGYRGKRKNTHEWAKLRRGTVTLDLHQHYPVMTYPEDVRAASAAEMRAASNPGRWRLPLRETHDLTEETHIRWDDLAAGAAPGVVEGTEELRFPPPEVLCLIHCAHCLRNSITRLHYMNAFAESRVYELLSIRALTRLPTFDVSRFEALRDSFAAQDTVHHVNVLGEAFLGAAPLPERHQARGDGWPLFPEHLIFGGWVSLQGVDDFLEIRDVKRMLHQLHARAVPAECSLSLDDTQRLLTYGTPPAPRSRLNLKWDRSAGALTLEWQSADEAPRRELLIYFGYATSVRVRLDGGGRVVDVRQKSDYPWPEQATAERVQGTGIPLMRLTCPVPLLPSQFQSDKMAFLPLLVATRRLITDGESTESAWYLPLVLKR